MKIPVTNLFLFLCCIFVTSILQGQIIDIGNSVRSAKLNIAGTSNVLAVEGNNPFISFYSNNLYKGYLWYNSNKMELGSVAAEPVVIRAGYKEVASFNNDGTVNINNPTTTSEVLNVFGSVSLKGIKINGNAGNRGQVFTTGGPDLNPQWKTLPFADTRFSARLTGNTYNGALNYYAHYNTNPSAVTVNANSITINKAGLYHLDGSLSLTTSYTGTYTQNRPPTVSIFFLVDFAGEYDFYYGSYGKFMTERPDYGSSSTFKYFNTQEKFSYDIYLLAGSNLTLSRNFAGQPGPASHANNGTLTGILISE